MLGYFDETLNMKLFVASPKCLHQLHMWWVLERGPLLLKGFLHKWDKHWARQGSLLVVAGETSEADSHTRTEAPNN